MRMVRTTALRLVPAVVCGAGVALALAGPAAGQADPPGNNGTVKIDDVEFDDHPNNEPHVGCEFQVDFYGFDEAPEGEELTATVLFEAVPPTPAGGSQELLTAEVDIGEDEAGGGTDLDASATYDLTEELAGITPHPQQGWHVRLTVHAEGSQGADTKHKVFWVSGCGGSSTTTTTTPGSSTSTTAPGSSTTSTTTPESSTTTTPGATVTTSAPSPSTSVSPSSTTTAPDASEGGLPVTGSNTLPLVVGGAALILVGSTGVVVARRFRLTGGR
jgi:hypothetical protein